ncbi:hypothetical protein Nepgr_007434 [Nepenthes gracilis]|uniref:AAA+ ATPase domain-containing protein n=1 Tax=Nepenthes gracilis TaxID=150966 RepID=A0AAD3XIC2_NEPGR|nr:hypothetical protein Nepgr_007434 [Nepenthes gracilis]
MIASSFLCPCCFSRQNQSLCPPNSISPTTRTLNTKFLRQTLSHANFFSGYPRLSLGIAFCFSSLTYSPRDEEFDVELDRLLALLPEEMRARIRKHSELRDLIEVVMDLGRKPFARFPSGDFQLSDCPITFQDIEYATSQVGDFAIDNRAGISCSLHRISAIRNRKGKIIGLTCRIGRAITGSADSLRDLVKDGASLLVIGPPGVGKTTIIREIARMLADDYRKRVMIVDTSNEIGGDGDIPHAGIGSARRMQVPNSEMQHKVLIEAVENHMPQVIVIDEIGTKLEAMAASTISQRGIQLVATAHGITIENLIMNPALEMLVGGIQSVTLGDEEASRRGVQKTVLERKGPSTFNCGVELISRTELRVHHSLEATVDAILSGRSPKYMLCKINFQGLKRSIEGDPFMDNFSYWSDEVEPDDACIASVEKTDHSDCSPEAPEPKGKSCDDRVPLQLFLYGISEAIVIQGIKKLKLDDIIELTDNISEADVLLALQSKIKKNPRIEAAAKSHDIPVYVTKTSSLVQITKAICELMGDHEDELKEFQLENSPNYSEKTDALEEARMAIEQVVILKGEAVELLPRAPQILSHQIDLIQKYQLRSEIVGTNPEARLRIMPSRAKNIHQKQGTTEAVDAARGLEDFNSTNGDANGSLHSVDKLPLLPEYPSD